MSGLKLVAWAAAFCASVLFLNVSALAQEDYTADVQNVCKNELLLSDRACVCLLGRIKSDLDETEIKFLMASFDENQRAMLALRKSMTKEGMGKVSNFMITVPNMCEAGGSAANQDEAPVPAAPEVVAVSAPNHEDAVRKICKDNLEISDDACQCYLDEIGSTLDGPQIEFLLASYGEEFKNEEFRKMLALRLAMGKEAFGKVRNFIKVTPDQCKVRVDGIAKEQKPVKVMEKKTTTPKPAKLVVTLPTSKPALVPVPAPVVVVEADKQPVISKMVKTATPSYNSAILNACQNSTMLSKKACDCVSQKGDIGLDVDEKKLLAATLNKDFMQMLVLSRVMSLSGITKVQSFIKSGPDQCKK